jgi:hypothetical protein
MVDEAPPALSGYQLFQVGRLHAHEVPVWVHNSAEHTPSPRQPAPIPPAAPRRQLSPAPHRQAPVRSSPRAERMHSKIHRATAARSSPVPHAPRFGATSDIHASLLESQPHRLTPRQRRDALLAINDSYINDWLRVRGSLPAYRTITKARRAALAGCFRLLDPEDTGTVGVKEAELLLRALGFRTLHVAAVVATSKPGVEGRLSAAEFTRLCIEAEGVSCRAAPAPVYLESPQSAADAFPLALLMERQRIRDLIDGHVRSLNGSKSPDGGASTETGDPPLSRRATSTQAPPAPMSGSLARKLARPHSCAQGGGRRPLTARSGVSFVRPLLTPPTRPNSARSRPDSKIAVFGPCGGSYIRTLHGDHAYRAPYRP